MLSGVEKTKVVEPHFGAPNMTHPFSVKAHVDGLSEDQQKPIRQEISKKLQTMLYIKNLEEMLTLYDLYDIQDERDSMKDQYHLTHLRYKGKISFFWGALACSGFLLYKRHSLLHFDSYLKNIYALTSIFGFTYTLLSAAVSSNVNRKMQAQLRDSSIISAKGQIHSEAISLTNRLRFNMDEVK